MRKASAVVFACFVGLTSGLTCCRKVSSLGQENEVVRQQPEGAFSLSKRVMLIADNQLHHQYGDPIWIRSEFTNQLVGAAIRPVQQDFFGHSILAYALQNYARGNLMPVIHLGDALDVGCSGEFDRFVEIFSGSLATSGPVPPQPWVLAPGNHDAYLMGNTQAKRQEWEEACRRGGGPLTKDLLVERYLEALREQPRNQGLKADLTWPPPLQGVWQSPHPDEDFLVALAWKIDRERVYRSFVAQMVNLSLPAPSPGSAPPPPVFAVILDSSQYASAPSLLPNTNAGVNGSFQSDQAGIVDSWLSHDPSATKLTFLMSHHPYNTLMKTAKDAVDRFRLRYRIPLYLSAHTHHGEYVVNQSETNWLELNLGSILDWPIEFRTLSIHQNEKLKLEGRFAVRSKLFRIPDVWSTAEAIEPPLCPTEWETETEAADFYIFYQDLFSPDPALTQNHLADALLRTHRRMLVNIPSDPDNSQWPPGTNDDTSVIDRIGQLLEADLESKLDFLEALERFDRNRRVRDDRRQRDYRLCNAVWASKVDALKGRKPAVQDTYIIVPWRSEP